MITVILEFIITTVESSSDWYSGLSTGNHSPGCTVIINEWIIISEFLTSYSVGLGLQWQKLFFIDVEMIVLFDVYITKLRCRHTLVRSCITASDHWYFLTFFLSSSKKKATRLLKPLWNTTNSIYSLNYLRLLQLLTFDDFSASFPSVFPSVSYQEEVLHCKC